VCVGMERISVIEVGVRGNGEDLGGSSVNETPTLCEVTFSYLYVMYGGISVSLTGFDKNGTQGPVVLRVRSV